jgi:glyoxylase-like metal-dependent hydrolase (beta-lactamase superfamily II)
VLEITGVEQKRCWDERVDPPVEKVRPGLWSIPVPIPDSPLRYVLVYALELAGDAGVAIVDAGWDTDDAWSALVGGLGQAGFAPTDVRAVLVTHIHPDHYGLAGRVREASGAWVALHPADAAAIPDRYGDGMDRLIESSRAILRGCGVPQPDAAELANASVAIRQFVTVTTPDVLLEDGDRPDLPGWDLRAVWTPGHSPGHLCFVSPERRLVMSGDHVLPRITPSIAVHAQSGPNPLPEYLASLAKIGALDAELSVEEVLPAHEYRFRGLSDRTKAIIEHHHERLTDTVTLLVETPGATCWELTARTRWSRPWAEIPIFMRRAATGETLAHLTMLAQQGRARSEGDDPERWYATAR